ncbi:MAG: flagellar hook-length control protein FliK [Rhodobacteraceae bacterium]|nr:flagellar hook-length control protein FliK [Paracoccaceae bacterium]
MDALAASDFYAAVPQAPGTATDANLNADGAFSSLFSKLEHDGAQVPAPAPINADAPQGVQPRLAQWLQGESGKAGIAAALAPPMTAAMHPESPALRFAAVARLWPPGGAGVLPDQPAKTDPAAPAPAEQEGDSGPTDPRSGTSAPEMLAVVAPQWASTLPRGAQAAVDTASRYSHGIGALDGLLPRLAPASPFTGAEFAPSPASGPGSAAIERLAAAMNRPVAADQPASLATPPVQAGPVVANTFGLSSLRLSAMAAEAGAFGAAEHDLAPAVATTMRSDTAPDGIPARGLGDDSQRLASSGPSTAAAAPPTVDAPREERAARAPEHAASQAEWQLLPAGPQWHPPGSAAGAPSAPAQTEQPAQPPLPATDAEAPLSAARFSLADISARRGEDALHLRVSLGAIAPSAQPSGRSAGLALTSGESPPAGQSVSDSAMRDPTPVSVHNPTGSAPPLDAPSTRMGIVEPAQVPSATAPSPGPSAAPRSAAPETGDATAEHPRSSPLRAPAAQPDLAAGAVPAPGAAPDLEVIAPGSGDAPFAQVTQPAASDRATTAPSAPPGHSAETAASVLRQVSDVVTRLPDRPVELTLAPEELGRVRLTLTTTEHGVSVSVLAERSETLELIRRNIDHLARDLRELGYSSIAFNFGDRPQHGPPGAHSQLPEAEAEVMHPTAPVVSGSAQTSHWPTAQQAGGLDLRL